jgi:hypothetical protein
MGWARSAWMAVTRLAFAPGERDGCEPKRALLLHSFGSDFQAEDVFAGYLMPEYG